MRISIILPGVMSLAVLAACGRTVPADQADAEPVEAEVAQLDMSSQALPEVPENALGTVDFAGTYVRDTDGAAEQLTLDPADDSYIYVAPDGEVYRGTFTRMDDNRRISIEDFNGQPAYFSVADGSIYLLDDVETPADRINVIAQFQREDTAGPPDETGEETEAGEQAEPETEAPE